MIEEDGTRLNREEGEEEPPFAAGETVSAMELPPGAHTGNALHELLETMDFAAAERAVDAEALSGDSRLVETAKRILRGNGLSEEYSATALKLAWNTLRMPLPDPAGGPPFQLASIAARKHEMEFLFPFAGLSPPVPLMNEEARNNIAIRNGFLWGFMDLIFRHQGRYYLLDWKSNLLDRYGARDIESDMRKHHYDLQYQLYAVALDKWLGARLPGYDPERDFGGVFYLYLRGASPGAFSGFAHRPDVHALRKDYPTRLRAALGLKLETREIRT